MVFFIVFELTRSNLTDRFSKEQIDENFPGGYLNDTAWCMKLKENLILNCVKEVC